MANLFWPGDERADGVADDGALLTAMLRVEQAWLDALVSNEVAPADAAGSLLDLVGDDDLPALSRGAESGGNPVIGLVALLRGRTSGATSEWLHRGLTSQDVLDTALVLLTRDATDRVIGHLEAQLTTLADLAVEHRDTPMVGRTLTQHAVPVTVGTKLAGWITSLADAHALLADARHGLDAQLGGAAGTRAATVELAGSPVVADDVLTSTAQALDLDLRAAVWHVARAPFPRSVTLGLGGDQRPLTDADPMRSPEPPDELWRVQ